MKIRIINTGLFLSFFICYMEWGKDRSSFIFEVEYLLFQKNKLIETITHPLILLGLSGQFCILISAIKNVPNKKLNIAGIVLLGTVVVMVLLAGLLSVNYKMILSSIPFLWLTVLYFRNFRK